MEGWAREGGTEAILARFRDPDARARIRREVEAQVRVDPGSWERVVVSRVKTEKNRPVAVGKTLVEIANGWGLDPVDAYLRLLAEEDTAVSFVGHGMSPENVERVLRHPLVMIGSDGSSMAPVGEAAKARPHPRSYGTFPRVLGFYARERGLFGLPTAVHKMTALPADQIGLADRGRIARGKTADLVAFDAARVRDTATFDDPHRFPGGDRPRPRERRAGRRAGSAHGRPARARVAEGLRPYRDGEGLLQEPGPGLRAAGVERRGQVDLRLVGREHGVAEGLDVGGLHQRDRAAAEPGPRHAGAEAGRLPPRDLGHEVELLARHLVEVAEAEVGVVHEPPGPREVARLQRLRGLDRPLVLGDDVARALEVGGVEAWPSPPRARPR